MEFLFRLRHYLRRFLLIVLGPAQLDDEHDPVKVEDRRYREHLRKRAG